VQGVGFAATGMERQRHWMSSRRWSAGRTKARIVEALMSGMRRYDGCIVVLVGFKCAIRNVLSIKIAVCVVSNDLAIDKRKSRRG
jgi:hypothetical protein